MLGVCRTSAVAAQEKLSALLHSFHKRLPHCHNAGSQGAVSGHSLKNQLVLCHAGIQIALWTIRTTVLRQDRQQFPDTPVAPGLVQHNIRLEPGLPNSVSRANRHSYMGQDLQIIFSIPNVCRLLHGQPQISHQFLNRFQLLLAAAIEPIPRQPAMEILHDFCLLSCNSGQQIPPPLQFKNCVDVFDIDTFLLLSLGIDQDTAVCQNAVNVEYYQFNHRKPILSACFVLPVPPGKVPFLRCP